MQNVWMITGASGGLGKGIAEAALRRGDAVALTSRSPVKLNAMVAEFPKQAMAVKLELDRIGSMEKALHQVYARFGRIDVLVNNAGIFLFRSVVCTEPGRIDLFIDLHMRAVTHLCRTFALDMKQRGCRGYILNMSSMSCWMPMPGIAMYSATKAYIRVLSRSLAVELADDGITVMVACPGGIATDLFGLPRRLQRLGVRLGALATPQRFVAGALRRLFRRRRQYINGLLNRIAIVAVAMLPHRLRLVIKHRLLDRLQH